MDLIVSVLVMFLLVVLSQLRRGVSNKKPLRMVAFILGLIALRVVPRPPSTTAQWIYTVILAGVVIPYVWLVWLDYIKPGIERWRQ